jgi:hypothetical protein
MDYSTFVIYANIFFLPLFNPDGADLLRQFG